MSSFLSVSSPIPAVDIDMDSSSSPTSSFRNSDSSSYGDVTSEDDKETEEEVEEDTEEEEPDKVEKEEDDGEEAMEDSKAAEMLPKIDIVISNVVCRFSVGCPLDTYEIAMKGVNVELEKSKLTMFLRHPYANAMMWPSGKVVCKGATTEEDAKVASRRFARVLQKMGCQNVTRLKNFKITNVMATCKMPFEINVVQFAQKYRDRAGYEPELMSAAVNFKIDDPKATMKIYHSGNVTILAPSVQGSRDAIEHLYALVYEFRKDKSARISGTAGRLGGIKRKRK